MDDFRDIIERYLVGELKDAEQAELARWLEADEANRQAFLAEVDFYRTVRGVLIQEQQELAKQAEASSSDQLLAVEIDSDALTMQKYISAFSYVLRHTFTPKRLITGGIAAAVFLVAVLAMVLLTGGPDEAEPITAELEDTGEPFDADQEPPTTPPVVATLTAERDAVWLDHSAEGALAPGSALYAGQRLTLTAGYAKLTTRRGAVALLEAPCSIELIDSPNAIRLHTGKLVGICETDRSKGFMVRTPHLDITDIGTRFGVAAYDTTTVQVIQGEVELVSGSEPIPVRLTTGAAAEYDPLSQRIARVEEPRERFATDWNAVEHGLQFTGGVRFAPKMPRDLRTGATEDVQALVFHERSAVQLDRPVKINLKTPGRFAPDTMPEPTNLQGLTVDSYFLHFDAVLNEAVTQQTISITFDRPILGVITTSEQLVESHQHFGQPGVAYGNQSVWIAEYGEPIDGSGLDLSKTEAKHTDVVQLSEDRRTLTLDLIVMDAIDQVRIIVEPAVQPD